MTYLEKIFWLSVAIGGEDDCWLWLGSKNKDGYGNFTIGRKGAYAHRVAVILSDGLDEAPTLQSLHSCHVPACCNPKHLRWGTHTENMADKARAGRSNRGERGGMARLTTPQIMAIRADTRPVSKIAADYGIAVSYAYKIRRGEKWTHIPLAVNPDP